MTINVTENKDKSFTITWDMNDPIESILNDFTEEDFIKVITEYLEQLADESSTSSS
jgi:hypothetical protein